MLWESENEACEVCECSSMIKTGFNLSESNCTGFHSDACMEKENIRQRLGSSPLKNESDISLYGSSSPERVPCHSSRIHCSNQKRPLEDHDGNSQDSGYGDNNKFYLFARSLGVTPRRNYSQSYSKSSSLTFSSMDSMDDEFLEFTDLDQPLAEKSQLPNDFNTLISGTFEDSIDTKTISPESGGNIKPPLRRALSCNIENTPISSRVRSCLFKKDDVQLRSFKRPERPVESKSPIKKKRTKTIDDEEEEVLQLAAVPEFPRPILRRSVSATEESIKYALQRSSTEPDLIGDFTKSFCLPLTSGRHQDLKSITASTLALLMRGSFNHAVTTYKVIDCRYPYEFEGGHISGATNLYTKEQIFNHLSNSDLVPEPSADSARRNILVFHCEFSSERGPNLYRYLRKLDRQRNRDVYPALHYPEIYLLDGGYKSFYEQYTELCVPEAYKPMLHPEHSSDLCHFRAECKSWNSDRLRPVHRGNLKRLGFM